MTSEYKYQHVMRGKDKALIPLLLYKGKSVSYIAERFGLSKRFVKHFMLEYNNRQVARLGNKDSAYYDNENSYGKNTHHYTINSLSLDEKKILDEL